MNSTEKRIDKLKQEKKKVDENISKLKKKSADRYCVQVFGI